jgi:tRNA-2-methylthio-N6-dimethylallyladenosine synthase
LVLVNTCSIRDKAEQTIQQRLEKYNAVRINPKMKVGVLGCMAERLKVNSRRRKIVDLVVGPDAYKILQTFAEVEEGRDAINVMSKDETYGDISRSIDEQRNYRFGFHYAWLR